MTLGRAMAVWFGCFICAGIILFFYAGVGLYSIAGAGALTALITLGRFRRAKIP